MQDRLVYAALVAIALKLMIFPPSAQADACSTNGLLAHFMIEGNASDQSPSQRYCEVSGASLTTNRFGTANSAFLFDGIDDYLRVTNTAGFPRGRAAFTVAMWISFPAQSETLEHKFLMTVDGFEQWQFFIGRNGPEQSLEIYMGGQRVGGTTGLAWEFDNWYHVAFVRETNPGGVDTVRWYRNGVQINAAFTEAGNNAGDEEMSLTIGRRFNGYGPWIGGMDDIRVYDRALAPLEVAELAASPGCPNIEIARAIRLTHKGVIMGSTYDVEASSDMQAWTNVVDMFTATNTTMVRYLDADSSARFFRLRKQPETNSFAAPLRVK